MIVTEKMAAEAWELLRKTSGLAEDASFPYGPESVQVAYRHAAKNAHPDAGGSAGAFAAVDRAKHVLLEWLKRNAGAPDPVNHGPLRKCHICDGKGFVTQQRGFRALRINCGACRGSGDLDTEHDYGDGR